MELIAVTTTGVYCRPECSGRPRPENTRRFASAHAARAAGYRPCLRCKPDATVRYARMRSPVGELLLIGEARGLRGLYIRAGATTPCPAPEWRHDSSALSGVAEQIEQWFAGERTAFDLALVPQGTPFQRAVWDAVSAIPFGATRTYSQIAAAVGRPRAVRAVGAANGANPVCLVVPCHRVIGADGSLTGYAGGVARKRKLLERERRYPEQTRTSG